MESRKILTIDDYFMKGTELRIWLLEEHRLYLEDLETSTAKEYFLQFVEKWNDGTLPVKYYKGMTPETQEISQRTKYKWAFAKNLDTIEMGTLRDTVDKETNLKAFPAIKESSSATSTDNSVDIEGHPLSKSNLSQRFPVEDHESGHNYSNVADDDDEDHRRMDSWKKKKDSKDYRKFKEMIEEEIVPKPTGREAMIEKRKEKNSFTKKTDDNTDFELRDSEIYGGSDFKERLQREKQRFEKKKQEQQMKVEQKLEEYKKKEAEKMAPFLSLIKSGQIPLMQTQKNATLQ